MPRKPPPKPVTHDEKIQDKLDRYNITRDDTECRINAAGLYEPLTLNMRNKLRPQDNPVVVRLYQDPEINGGWRYSVTCDVWKEPHADIYGFAAIRSIPQFIPTVNPPAIAPVVAAPGGSHA